jgi:hypothetical protein
VVRVMVVVMMCSGTADHFHAGSHFHAALKRSRGCDTISRLLRCVRILAVGDLTRKLHDAITLRV